jgi:hypothetical protein
MTIQKLLPTLSPGQVIQGTVIKYNLDSRPSWNADGLPIPDKMLALATGKIVRRFAGETPLQTIFPDANDDLPDVGELNQQIPESEWHVGRYGPKPPWSLQHIVYFLSVENAGLYTFISSSTGAKIAVANLESSIQWMRALRRCPDATPLVRPGDAPMKTGYGLRRRPDFLILSWHSLSGNGEQLAHGELKALPPVTIAEELNDEIRF